MYKKPTIAQAKYFQKEFCSLLDSFGAVKIEYRPRKKCDCFTLEEETTYTLETKIGKLTIKVSNDCLYCKFNDVARAKFMLWRDYTSRLNPYSGKWNWHFGEHTKTEQGTNECVLAFDCEMSKLLL